MAIRCFPSRFFYGVPDFPVPLPPGYVLFARPADFLMCCRLVDHAVYYVELEGRVPCRLVRAGRFVVTGKYFYQEWETIPLPQLALPVAWGWDRPPLMVGRSLHSLSPVELEDLLRVNGINPTQLAPAIGHDIEEYEGCESLHPDLGFFPDEGRWKIFFAVWGEGEDADYHNAFIEDGSVWAGWGEPNAMATIRWFLDHGWTWNHGRVS